VRAVPSPRELNGPGLEESARQFFALVTEACVVSAGSAGVGPLTVQPADGRGQHVGHQQCARPHTLAGWKPALPVGAKNDTVGEFTGAVTMAE